MIERTVIVKEDGQANIQGAGQSSARDVAGWNDDAQEDDEWGDDDRDGDTGDDLDD